MSANFPICKGTLLASHYKVEAFLGQGTFGKVAKCVDTVTNRQVAIKITKNDPIFTQQALEEIKILKQLHTLDPDKCHFVRWNGSFFHKRLVCLNFELLDLTLYNYMKGRSFRSLSMGVIRPVLHQISTALLHLKALQIVHADIKLDNIMIVDRRQQPMQVKLIDFGLAHHVSAIVPGKSMQNLWYRAPEVMLGLDYSEPIDMWSLGTIAAELALGFPLFPGSHEYDVMKFIVDTLGQPPNCQLNCGQYSSKFFKIHSNFNQHSWRLMTTFEITLLTGHHFIDTRHFDSLDALEEMMYVNNKSEGRAVQLFVDLLKKMLQVDKFTRIIPLKVLEHPFFFVEQHNMDIQIQRVTKDGPEVTQQPPSQRKSVALKVVIPPEETGFAENISLNPEDAALIQPKVSVETSNSAASFVVKFFQSIRKAFSACSCFGN